MASIECRVFPQIRFRWHLPTQHPTQRMTYVHFTWKWCDDKDSAQVQKSINFNSTNVMINLLSQLARSHFLPPPCSNFALRIYFGYLAPTFATSSLRQANSSQRTMKNNVRIIRIDHFIFIVFVCSIFIEYNPSFFFLQNLNLFKLDVLWFDFACDKCLFECACYSLGN